MSGWEKDKCLRQDCRNQTCCDSSLRIICKLAWRCYMHEPTHIVNGFPSRLAFTNKCFQSADEMRDNPISQTLLTSLPIPYCGIQGRFQGVGQINDENVPKRSIHQHPVTRGAGEYCIRRIWVWRHLWFTGSLGWSQDIESHLSLPVVNHASLSLPVIRRQQLSVPGDIGYGIEA